MKFPKYIFEVKYQPQKQNTAQSIKYPYSEKMERAIISYILSNDLNLSWDNVITTFCCFMDGNHKANVEGMRKIMQELSLFAVGDPDAFTHPSDLVTPRVAQCQDFLQKNFIPFDLDIGRFIIHFLTRYRTTKGYLCNCDTVVDVVCSFMKESSSCYRAFVMEAINNLKTDYIDIDNQGFIYTRIPKCCEYLSGVDPKTYTVKPINILEQCRKEIAAATIFLDGEIKELSKQISIKKSEIDKIKAEILKEHGLSMGKIAVNV